jgi:N-carbamoyl-D-amino-acid hydrolase
MEQPRREATILSIRQKTLIGGFSIIAPYERAGRAGVTQDDEFVVARCELEAGRSYKRTTFGVARHREPEQYRMIVDRKRRDRAW